MIGIASLHRLTSLSRVFQFRYNESATERERGSTEDNRSNVQPIISLCITPLWYTVRTTMENARRKLLYLIIISVVVATGLTGGGIALAKHRSAQRAAQIAAQV